MRRRDFLSCCGASAASLSLYSSCSLAAELNAGHPLAPRPTHHAAKAKNLLIVFLTGGMSHVDTFDYKPKLSEDNGQDVPSFGLRADETTKKPLLGSPFKFQQHGQSGLWLSELFPHLGKVADELC